MSVSLLQPLATLGSSVEDSDGNTVFVLDATTNESHDNVGAVTKSPIEEGADVTDHFRLEPFELEITGVVTNTPIDPAAIAAEAALTGAGFTETRVQATYNTMLELLAAGGLLTIITGLRTYENMMMTSVRIVRTGPGRQEIRPQMKFSETQFAVTAYVAIPSFIVSRPKRPSGSSEKNLEQQAKKDASKDEIFKYDENKTKLDNVANNLARLATKLQGPG